MTEKTKAEFNKTMLIKKAGMWLECSDYEGTVNDILTFIDSHFIDKRVLEEKIEKIYLMAEKDTPPKTISPSEKDYNDGFFQGRLTMIEKVTRSLTGKNGDDLKSLLK